MPSVHSISLKIVLLNFAVVLLLLLACLNFNETILNLLVSVAASIEISVVAKFFIVITLLAVIVCCCFGVVLGGKEGELMPLQGV